MTQALKYLHSTGHRTSFSPNPPNVYPQSDPRMLSVKENNISFASLSSVNVYIKVRKPVQISLYSSSWGMILFFFKTIPQLFHLNYLQRLSVPSILYGETELNSVSVLFLFNFEHHPRPSISPLYFCRVELCGATFAGVFPLLRLQVQTPCS